MIVSAQEIDESNRLAASQCAAARLQRYDRPGPRYTSYPTAVEFTDRFDEAAYRGRLEAAAAIAGRATVALRPPARFARRGVSTAAA